MAGPWEKYASAPTSAPAATGPWSKYSAASVPLVDQIPPTDNPNAQVSAPAAKPADEGFMRTLAGALEVPLAIGTGTIGGVVGGLAGVAKSVTGGNYGTQQGVREGAETAGAVSNALTYQPRTQTGGKLLESIGNAINDSGIVGVPIPELNALARTAGPVRNAMTDMTRAGVAKTADAAVAGKNYLTEMTGMTPAQKPGMVGVGAAMTDEAMLRAQRAQDLPVPINLTKGQATRTFEQQRFERETAKLPEGERLRQRFADQNHQVLQNFDAWLDETGAAQPNLRGTGETVVKALSDKKATIKAEVNAAYGKAREAGHMSDPVDVSSLSSYVEKNRSAARNAPILSTIEDEITRLSKDGKTISLNDVEELRKMVGKLSEPGTPNGHYGQEALRMIDDVSRDKGGPLYQQARRTYENYAKQFKDRAVVDKLLRTKPGTADRSVAFEDVFKHSVLDGSLDDVRHMRRVLQTAGPEGEQAWRELQGQSINQMKESITANVARNERGQPIVSPAALDKIVRGLDADGKLDFIFGKKAAQQLRDVNDLAKDIYTSPPGSVNSSNTASVLIGLLDTAISGMSGVPLPIGTAINFGVKKVKSNVLNRKVDESLNALADPPKPPLLH